MIISTTFDPEDGVYRLMVSDGKLSNAPAGPRLFRAEPHPDIRFEHATREEAETDAAKLRAYLAALPVAKGTARDKSYKEGD